MYLGKLNIDLATNHFRTFEIWTKCKLLKFIYSEKATNFCVISTVDLSYVVTVKYTMEITQKFVAFSEYMNFKG